MSLTPETESATTPNEENQLHHQLPQKRLNITTQPITLILPTSGKLFYEKKKDFQLCKPQLLPLKSFSLEKLEKMQQEAHRQLQETRARTAVAEKF
ncbi:BBSome-interacting protein 1 [Topomyia yanbarensis]|uniref:BBSome-interacting protein 1 n=1 Tax=Topomyia yanbarensis TaxID=2498891 RepID=UPI00273CE52F|nr:BBSome-interacting protein 1 [Topomyia yanbarensis]XP_058813207.1 BBSome-interacting protein 1 [Topomyia yanbarensis]